MSHPQRFDPSTVAEPPARGAATGRVRWRRCGRPLAATIVVSMVLTAAVAACGGGDGDRSDEIAALDPRTLVEDSASAMGAVTSMEFALEVSGTPVFIDQFDAIAIETMIGQFTAPRRAAARLDVEVGGSLQTRIGAIAIDDEFWISDPITGEFSVLPEGFDIDPSRFFDPKLGWQPLLESLGDIESLGADDRGGLRAHVRGTAPAEQVADITVGLVDGQSLEVDLWIDPDTALVAAIEFTTQLSEGPADWVVEFDHYGDPVTIEAPEGVS